jgi:Dynein light chain type 1
MSERKAVIKNADMSEDMQQDAVDCASQALEKYNIEKVCQSFMNFEHPKYLLIRHSLTVIYDYSGYCCIHQKGI